MARELGGKHVAAANSDAEVAKQAKLWEKAQKKKKKKEEKKKKRKKKEKEEKKAEKS